MPKRKRSAESAIQNKLEKYRIDLFRALSSAKAFERKRFSSRLREPGITVAKKARLEREFGVFKALDLRQTARNHLHSNLLRIKAVEASKDIPEELRAGVPRPNISQEETTLQNNVISVLCNAGPARQVLDRAVADICETLGVPVPVKSKRARKDKRKDAEEQPSDRISSPAAEETEEDEETAKPAPKSKKSKKSKVAEQASEEESEFEGFESDADEPGSAASEPSDVEGSDEEAAISKYDQLLGGSSDEEEEEFDEGLLAKYRGREQVNLDDISLSGSASDMADEDIASEAGSPLPSPRPTKKAKGEDANNVTSEKVKGAKTKEKKEKELKEPKEVEETKEERKKRKAARAAAKAARPGNSTFLPSLMGGYISGSESASDIDAPPKKRRGQRARRAIFEKKYGANANHLKKEAAQGGRDAGWDMRRGAVGPEDRGRGKPWQKGGRVPPGRDNRGDRGNRDTQARDNFPASKPKPETKKDNEGPLHPSWEARKKAKDAQKVVEFSGQKIVFD